MLERGEILVPHKMLGGMKPGGTGRSRHRALDTATAVAASGGWKGTHAPQTVYQHPNPETLEEVVLGGRELRLGPQSGPRKVAGGEG